MRRLKIGDHVRSFMHAEITGEIVDIVYSKGKGTLMVGGVPTNEAFALVKLANGNIVRIKTTELSRDYS